MPAGSELGVVTGTAVPGRPEPVVRRYVATLAAQSVQLVTAAVTAAIVPRALGPAAFGSYTFLLTTAGTMRGFTEPSVQQAFFTFSSQDHQSGSLTRAYAAWVFAQLGLLLGIIAVASILHVRAWVWPGQSMWPIVAVTVLDWLVFVGLGLRQLGDSKGLTVRPQTFTAGTAVVAVVALLALAIAGRLTFFSFVAVNLAAALVTACVTGWWLFTYHAPACWTGSIRAGAQQYLGRWWRYAKPLIVLEYYTPLVAFVSTYLIQLWYGSAEQGYLGLAMRWSALVLVFTGAAVNIVWREVAASMAAGDATAAGRIYLRLSHLLVFLAAALGVWLSLSSPTLIVSIVGEAYRPAVPVLTIMAFYPLAQTCAQLSVGALKAAERTALYRDWAVLISVPDLLLSYLLLAPATAIVPGLALGAVGVALKTAIYSLITVHVYEWAACRLFDVPFAGVLRSRVLMLGTLFAFGLVTLVLSSRWAQSVAHVGPIVAAALSSAAYFAAVGWLALRWPSLVGMDRADVDAARRTALSVIGVGV